MDKPEELLIATFSEEHAAKDVRDLLKKWASSHDIKVVNAAVVEKDQKSHTSVHQDQDVRAGQGTVFGAVVGGLIGLVGGPAGVVAGAAAGAATGGATAATVNFGFSRKDLDEIRNNLTPGSSALVTLIEDRYTEDVTRELKLHSAHIWHNHLPKEYYDAEGVK
jgi:uncharacterized membrane protein